MKWSELFLYGDWECVMIGNRQVKYELGLNFAQAMFYLQTFY